jgi:hypothetical protein
VKVDKRHVAAAAVLMNQLGNHSFPDPGVSQQQHRRPSWSHRLQFLQNLTHPWTLGADYLQRFRTPEQIRFQFAHHTKEPTPSKEFSSFKNRIKIEFLDLAEVLNQSKKKMDCLNDSNRIHFREAETILLKNLPFG